MEANLSSPIGASPKAGILRSLLVLGRVSNLPTVWSNCLAGWLISGGGEPFHFLILCAAATVIYTGGMYLNDAFDAEFDAQYLSERPIPMGNISLRSVWRLGWAQLIFGGFLLLFFGKETAFLAALLIGCVIVYDAFHKVVTYGPILMASCRFLLYLTAGSVAEGGFTGLTVWSGLAMAAYIVGLSYLARRESFPGPMRFWPVFLLVVPVLLAMVVNSGNYVQSAWVWSMVLLAWIALSLRHTYWSKPPFVGRSVAALLAGIPLVDLLALLPGSPMVFLFLGFLGLSLLLQKKIPAT
jgi:hypothetical protein